jgi:hypothetical protein
VLLVKFVEPIEIPAANDDTIELLTVKTPVIVSDPLLVTVPVNVGLADGAFAEIKPVRSADPNVIAGTVSVPENVGLADGAFADIRPAISVPFSDIAGV